MTFKERRKAAGLTAKALSEASGIYIRQIQRLDSGESQLGNVTAANAVSLAKALNTTVEDLLEER